MTPVRYRWDRYAYQSSPKDWITFSTWPRLARALRALRLPQERLRIEYDNGQQVVVRVKVAKA